MTLWKSVFYNYSEMAGVYPPTTMTTENPPQALPASGTDPRSGTDPPTSGTYPTSGTHPTSDTDMPPDTDLPASGTDPPPQALTPPQAVCSKCNKTSAQKVPLHAFFFLI